MSADLEQLLTNADATATAPIERIHDMGQQVRSIARRRRNTRAIASAAAMVLIALSAIYAAVRPHPAVPIVHHDVPPPSLEAMKDAIAAIDAEADARMAIVERLQAAEQQRNSAKRSSAQDPLVAVQREQDRAAYMLIHEADRLAQIRNERARAEQEYRRVLALFPDTHWASVARERLVELNGASKAPAAGPTLHRGGIEELS